jgi:hypothetical protein
MAPAFNEFAELKFYFITLHHFLGCFRKREAEMIPIEPARVMPGRDDLDDKSYFGACIPEK